MVEERQHLDCSSVISKLLEYRGTVESVLRVTSKDDTLPLDEFPLHLQLQVVAMVGELLEAMPPTRLV